MLRKIAPLVFGLLALLAFPRVSQASFHLWKIQEIYSNADGSVQFIELVDASNGENLVNGKTITANSDGTIKTFTFHANLSSATTANKHILIATPGFASLPGAVTPDFTLPCGPFFDPAAVSITISYAGTLDVVTFAGSSLPTTGTNSLIDAMPTASDSSHLAAGTSSPVNFAGNTGAMALTGCLQTGSCEPCDDHEFCTGVESCSGSACVATGACDLICNELADTCVECNGPGDCDDGNDCTDDTCPVDTCVHTNNTDPCDDGLFCSASDACSGGACVGSGDACAASDGGSAAQCLEGIDACGACALASDCDDADPCTTESCTVGVCAHPNAPNGTACASDGLFCSGIEECVAGACTSPGDPCAASESCSESGDQCVALCSGVCADAGLNDGGLTHDAAGQDASPMIPTEASDASGPVDDGGDAGGGPGSMGGSSGGGGRATHQGGGAGFSDGYDGSVGNDTVRPKSSSGCNCSIPRASNTPFAPGLLLAFALTFRRISRRRR